LTIGLHSAPILVAKIFSMVYSALLLFLVFVHAEDVARLQKVNTALRQALSSLAESQVGAPARWETQSRGAWGEISIVDPLRNCNERSGYGGKEIELCSAKFSCEHGKFPARNCIDGNENTMCHSCDGRSGTLTVKLPNMSVVSAIRIKNRSFARNRIMGAKVKIDGFLCSDVDGNAFVGNLKKFKDRDDIDDYIYMDCGNKQGSTITISSQNGQELHMMEVKVMEPCKYMPGGEYQSSFLRELRATYPDYRKFQC